MAVVLKKVSALGIFGCLAFLAFTDRTRALQLTSPPMESSLTPSESNSAPQKQEAFLNLNSAVGAAGNANNDVKDITPQAYAQMEDEEDNDQNSYLELSAESDATDDGDDDQAYLQLEEQEMETDDTDESQNSFIQKRFLNKHFDNDASYPPDSAQQNFLQAQDNGDTSEGTD